MERASAWSRGSAITPPAGRRTTFIAEGTPKKDSDAIFLSPESEDALKRLGPLQKRIKRNGAIWVVAPKGERHITENDVLSAGKETGFVDVKVVSFSETHTAHKFVIPVPRR